MTSSIYIHSSTKTIGITSLDNIYSSTKTIGITSLDNVHSSSRITSLDNIHSSSRITSLDNIHSSSRITSLGNSTGVYYDDIIRLQYYTQAIRNTLFGYLNNWDLVNILNFRLPLGQSTQLSRRQRATLT